jgi:hypothetical protein
MGERWVLIWLVRDESLRCHSCSESISKEEAHLYIDVDDEIEEVMCDKCWSKNKREMKE